jgi:hypothetical protein
MKGGAKVIVEPHRHEGIFVARGKEDALVTLNSTPGVSVYGEKRISVEIPPTGDQTTPQKVEYRVWNPFRSKRECLYVDACLWMWMWINICSSVFAGLYFYLASSSFIITIMGHDNSFCIFPFGPCT